MTPSVALTDRVTWKGERPTYVIVSVDRAARTAGLVTEDEYLAGDIVSRKVAHWDDLRPVEPPKGHGKT